jgi:CRISPR-associated protein Cas1
MTRVAAPDLLTSAWADVLAKDRDDGVLGAGVARFAEDAEERLCELSAHLGAGTYLPDRLTPVPLLRHDGATRQLHVPSVRDRIVERAVLAVLTPIVDPWLGPFSYAYRPGLGSRTPSRPSHGYATRAWPGLPGRTSTTASLRSRSHT